MPVHDDVKSLLIDIFRRHYIGVDIGKEDNGVHLHDLHASLLGLRTARVVGERGGQMIGPSWTNPIDIQSQRAIHAEADPQS